MASPVNCCHKLSVCRSYITMSDLRRRPVVPKSSTLSPTRRSNTSVALAGIVGVVGSLQFDVLADRVRTEYKVEVRFESTSLFTARWLGCDDEGELRRFCDENVAALADDHVGSPVFLARNDWHLERAQKDYPKIEFLKTKEQSWG